MANELNFTNAGLESPPQMPYNAAEPVLKEFVSGVPHGGLNILTRIVHFIMQTFTMKLYSYIPIILLYFKDKETRTNITKFADQTLKGP